jgi:hypothetical protein
MTRQQPDEDLHAAFQSERAVERGRVPPYAVVAAGRAGVRQRRPRRIRWLLVSGALATLVAGFWLVLQAISAREIDLARRVMAGKSSTGFLLEGPSISLLDSIPRFGMSVPGSPLRALDPGGPLGPPLTRSPGT